MRPNFFLLTISCVFSVVLIIPIASLGQVEVKGVVTAAHSNKPLSYATIAIYKIDSTLISYRISTENGRFSVSGMPLQQPCFVVVSFSGYQSFSKQVLLPSQPGVFSLDTVRLQLLSNTLAEVYVTGMPPPVVYKNDTIEFIASAFKTLPTALVEDLLRKLPGVTVDRSGTIFVEGKIVNRILVDGKRFFGGDPKMATRNLPANIINKVQVTYDEDELLANPQLASHEAGRVINLSLKKSVKKQVFGRGALGAGTEDRWEGSMILNTFRDTLQVSVLGFGNNINRAAFGYAELRDLGGFKRSNTALSMRTGGGIMMNNISFGGTDQGILKSYGGGFNLNNDFNKKLSMNLQYFYGETNNSIGESMRQYQFLKDKILITANERNEIRRSMSNRIGGNLKWVNNKTRIEYRPMLTFGRSRNDADNRYSVSDSSGPLGMRLNTSVNKDLERVDNLEYAHTILFNRQFNKGKVLTLNQDLLINGSDGQRTNQVVNTLYENGSPYKEEAVNQQRIADNHVASIGLSGNFRNPLSATVTLQIANSSLMFLGKSKLSTYDFNEVIQKYDHFDPSLSSQIDRNLFTNNFNAGTDLSFKKIKLGLYGQYIFYQIKDVVGNEGKSIRTTYHYLQPRVTVRWQDIDVSYNNSVTPPLVQDILPVRNLSNPILITLGNIGLKPVVTRNLRVNYFKYYKDKGISTNLYLSYQHKKDGVLYSRIVDADGVQTIYPINVDRQSDLVASGSFSKAFRWQNNIMLNVTAGFSYIAEKRLVQIEGEIKPLLIEELFPNLTITANLTDKLEIRSSVSVAARKQQRGELLPFFDAKTTVFRSNNDITFRISRKLAWESSIDYQGFSSSDVSTDTDVLLVNSNVVLSFLKDSRGQLKLSVFDLLNRNQLIGRTISDNFLIIRDMKVLNRYIMLTFYYDLRGLKLTKSDDSKRLLLF